MSTTEAIELTPAAARPRSGSGPLRFLARRVAFAILTLWIVSVLVFGATELLPGDPASTILGRNATPEAVAELQTRMKLDEPAPQRYGEWLAHFVTGDLGVTAVSLAQGGEGTKVWSEIGNPLRNSGILALITFALLVPLSLALGVWCAVKSGRTADHVISTSLLALSSVPEFVIGTLLLLLFFVSLGVLPGVALFPPDQSPLTDPKSLVLPVATLCLGSLAWATRVVRAGVVQALASDYVQMARLNGFPERMVVVRYALRNAVAPAVQVLALTAQYLIGGVIIVEALFAYPGLGKELVNSVGVRDVREVQSVVMLVASIYVAINILADLLVVFLVPRLRTEAR
jgi:peptide/nickel transport system permease protein